METYENGGYACHANIPTDTMVKFQDATKETQVIRFEVSATASRGSAIGSAAFWQRDGSNLSPSRVLARRGWW